MSYVDKILIAGETVLYKTRLHWIVLFWSVVGALFFAFLGIGLLIGGITATGGKSGSSGGLVGIGFLLLLAGAAILGLGVLIRNATEMAVTNKRVMIKTGLVTRRTTELLLGKIESIQVDEGLLGRILGYGTITVRGTGGTPEPFSKVAHPLEFRRQVQQQVEAQQMPRSVAV